MLFSKMNSQKNTTGPISHRDLRAFLDIAKKAIELGDISLLGNLQTISYLVEPENNQDVQDYINGESDRLASIDGEYRMYDDDDIKNAKDALGKVAYGDFNEAMLALEHDLKNISYANKLSSDIFKPEYFSENDRIIWEKLRSVATLLLGNKDGEISGQGSTDALRDLRQYQQKTYGSLIPVIFATYIKDEEQNKTGATVRLAWVDNEIHIQASAPFDRELDDFITNKHPTKSVTDFNQGNLPKIIGGYKLDSADRYDMFCYEL